MKDWNAERQQIIAASPGYTPEQVEERLRLHKRWRRQSIAKGIGIALGAVAAVTLFVLIPNGVFAHKDTPAELANEACESWRYYPNAHPYQEADVRDRMLRFSSQAAEADPAWEPLAEAIEQDRPGILPGTTDETFSDGDYSGPTTASGLARRAALRDRINADCRQAERLAQQRP